MSIEYEIIFNNPDYDELKIYLEGLPFFDTFDVASSAYIFRKSKKKYPDTVIVLHDLGLDLKDYLTGLGREQIGLLVEYLTGIYSEIIIKEKD